MLKNNPIATTKRKLYPHFLLFAFVLFASIFPPVLRAQVIPVGEEVSGDLPLDCPNRTQPGTTIAAFDWRANFYQLEIKGENGQDYTEWAPSPFFSANNSLQPNTDHLAFVNSPRDFQPEDGWELIYKNFGTIALPVAEPSFALYNRYSGLMRTFIYLTAKEGLPYQAATVNVQHVNLPAIDNQTTIFETLNTPMNAVDRFEKNIVSSTYNHYVESEGTWIMSEFVAAYDPCTCDLPTALEIAPILASVSNLTFSIEGTDTMVKIVKDGTTQTTADNGWLSALAGLVTTNATLYEKGKKTHGNLQGFSKFIDKVISKLFNLADESGEESGKLPGYLAAIPGIGTAISVLDMLVTGSKKSGAAHTVTQSSTRYHFDGSGQIDTDAPYQPNLVYTPGGDHTGFPSANLPIYDNPLGVASLIRTPRIKRYVFDHPTFWPNKTVVFLENDLQYAINTAAGINGTPKSVTASLIFTNCHGDHPQAQLPETLIEITDSTWRTPFLPPGCLADYMVQFEDYTHNHCDGDMRVRIRMVLERAPADPDADDIFIMFTYRPDIDEIQVVNETDLPGYSNILAPVDPLYLEQNLDQFPCAAVSPMTPSQLSTFCTNVYDPKSLQSPPGEPKKTDLAADLSAEIALEIFPNPVTDYAFVRGIEGQIQIKLYDLRGKLLRSQEMSGEEDRLDLSGLPRGMLMVEVLDAQGTLRSTMRLVKQ
ncbi:MAG: T9SS type A sorting domain-containing protein [Bacteroidota bacterium]